MRSWVPAVALCLLLAGGALFLVNRRPGPAAPSPVPGAPPSPSLPAVAASASPRDGGTLRVDVEGVAAGSASVAFALFADAAAFDAATPSRKARLAPGVTTWTLEGLERGTYAVKAYVDRDGNGELNRGAFGAPSEPYGFSRDARGTFGPPSFAEAAFTFDGKSLSISFRVR